MRLSDLKGTFTQRIGLNVEGLFGELERLAKKLGIGPSDELTEAFIKQAKAIYSAYLAQVQNRIVDIGFEEVLELLQTGRVPKRKKRVGASTA